ncbi:hypothetical protein AN958_05323 [Leucoagaricus sp. SymC.cos]|nr:hypothetical protein AN958_05323 [Leucoagaricus sp. SymC.cos]
MEALFSPFAGLIIKAVTLRGRYRQGDLPEVALPFIPPPSRPDYLNGKSYYIRSRARPDCYWIANFSSSDSPVWFFLSNSSDYPTRFIIRRTTPLSFVPRAPEEDVLIASDEVTLNIFNSQSGLFLPASGPSLTNPLAIHTDQSSISGNESPFKFSFGALTSQAGFALQNNMIVYRGAGCGDHWDLVN